MRGIKVVAFDTGGTVLDWHSGLVAGLAECGARRGVEHDWHGFANEYRRRSLKRMLGAVEPAYNIDEVHRDVLDELLDETAIDAFRQRIAGPSRSADTNLQPVRILCLRCYGCDGATSAPPSRSSVCPWSSMCRGATASPGMQ